MVWNTRVGMHLQSKADPWPNIHEIDEALLSDPIIGGEKKEHYLGRGSFGIVKLQVYRGIHVAVKELLPRSVKEDVKNEAQILARLCHPYVSPFWRIYSDTTFSNCEVTRNLTI